METSLTAPNPYSLQYVEVKTNAQQSPSSTHQKVSRIYALPPQSGKKVSKSIKEAAAFNSESGCALLGTTLMVHILDCFEQVNARKIGLQLFKVYSQACLLFMEVIEAITTYSNAVEGCVNIAVNKQQTIKRAKNALQQARQLITSHSPANVPSQIIKLTCALHILEIQIGVDFEALIYPIGKEIDESSLIASFLRYERVLEKLLKRIPPSLLSEPSMEEFRQAVGKSFIPIKQLPTYLNAKIPNGITRRNLILGTTHHFLQAYESFLTAQSVFVRSQLLKEKGEFRRWAFELNLVMNGAVEELRRFTYSSRAEEQKWGKNELLTLYQTFIDKIQNCYNCLETHKSLIDLDLIIDQKESPWWLEEFQAIDLKLTDTLESTRKVLQTARTEFDEKTTNEVGVNLT